MAVVRSKIGKMTWKNYKFDGNGTKVSTRDAILLYGDRNVKVEFTADDKATIQRLMETSPKRVKHLSKHLRLRGPDAKGVMDSLYPRSRTEKIIGRATPPAPKKEEPKKEEKKGIPLPPDLNKLTVKMLKELLEERKLSTEGKKADLIKRLSEDG